MMKILITVPSLKLVGGVSLHYKGLHHYWNENVRYFEIGKRPGRPRFVTMLLYPFNILRFIFCICVFRPDVVLLNPSLNTNAIRRDLLCLNIARSLNRKVAVMFHGFDVAGFMSSKEELVSNLNKCSVIMVLAREFREQLNSWGVISPIELVTTKVDDSLLEDFDITIREGKIRNVLFLSRITEAKGIFVALDVMKKLAVRYPELQFTVVGEGPDLLKAEQYANLPQIAFLGKQKGKALADCYKGADCFLFTSFHEGMPAVVLEAMAFGLPVVTRLVGGVADFFVDGKMGFFVDSDRPEDYMDAFGKLLSSTALTESISQFNHSYANEHFLASAVARRTESILKQYISVY